MKAKRRNLHSPDADDLKTFAPLPADDFRFLLQTIVGPEAERGQESLDVIACTPDRLKRRFHTSDIILGHEKIIVLDYHYERLRSFIADSCGNCVADSWEIANKLAELERGNSRGTNRIQCSSTKTDHQQDQSSAILVYPSLPLSRVEAAHGNSLAGS
ncbi:MAG: hypothetical protein JO260_01230 [Acidobacteria bacterium]|nr:hypothetical protein [Acidobacteriota bacterium]